MKKGDILFFIIASILLGGWNALLFFMVLAYGLLKETWSVILLAISVGVILLIIAHYVKKDVDRQLEENKQMRRQRRIAKGKKE